MSSSSRLYDKIVLRGDLTGQQIPGTKTYKGFSTISPDANSFALYDLPLIKQDILNHFHIRQGERLENPEFGTIIWGCLFEPLTEEVKSLIQQNVESIVNYDPRVIPDQIVVTSYESGIQIECRLTYLPYNISETLQLRFDQANSIY